MPTFSAEELKTMTRRYVEELYGKQHKDIVYELVAPDFVYHTAQPPISPDREGVVQEVTFAFAAFPDLRFTIDELLVEGETIVMRYTIAGTHEGDFYGIPPTHRPMKTSGLVLARTRDGKLTEAYRFEDDLLLFQQLGVLPIPQAATAPQPVTAQTPIQG